MIKKVRFETVFRVRQFMDKHAGRRFELRVVTGRTMQLMADTTEEARQWVAIFRAVMGPFMGALQLQAAWRGWKARKLRKKLLAERAAAVARVAGRGAAVAAAGGGAGGTAAGGAAGAAGAATGGAGTGGLIMPPMATRAGATVHGTIKSGPTGIVATGAEAALKHTLGAPSTSSPSVSLLPEGVLLEGELKKKNSTRMASFLLGSTRTRYFVLYPPHGALYYFDTKAQRQLGAK